MINGSTEIVNQIRTGLRTFDSKKTVYKNAGLWQGKSVRIFTLIHKTKATVFLRFKMKSFIVAALSIACIVAVGNAAAISTGNLTSFKYSNLFAFVYLIQLKLF